jgi:membrane protease YdiL (CAAX protease family)
MTIPNPPERPEPIELPEPPPPPPPAIPLWVPFVVMLAVLLVVNIVGVAVYGVLAVSDPEIKEAGDLPDSATLGLTLLQDIVFVYAGWLAVKLALGVARGAEFGFVRLRRIWPAVGWAAAVYAGFWLVLAVLAAIFGQPEDQALVSDIKEQDDLLILLAWALLICLAAPFVEEFFFRGFMFGVFAARLGPLWGALLVGVVFGIAHAPAEPIQLIALGVLGVGLCALRWRTQSIIPCMALHALQNSITFGVVKDLEPALFAGVVVLSVGAVIAASTALSSRSAVTA